MAEEEPSVKQLPDGSQVICEGGVCRLLPPPARQDASDTGEEEGKTNEEQGEDTVERTQGGNPAFVAQHISMEQADQLVDFGFPRLRAEKALFHVRQQPGGGGIEAAVEWLEVHAEDEDIDEPIKEEEKPKEKVVLTEEEAQRRAYELQKKLREDRIEREKKEAIEREKLRLAQTKAMLEQNAKLQRSVKENNAFKSRVLPFEGALELLDVCGFKDTGDFLAISGQPDGFVLGQALKFLDVLLEQLKN